MLLISMLLRLLLHTHTHTHGQRANVKERRGSEKAGSGQRGSRNVLFINVYVGTVVAVALFSSSSSTTTTANTVAAAAAAAAATTRGDRGRGGVVFMKTRRLVSCELLLHL